MTLNKLCELTGLTDDGNDGTTLHYDRGELIGVFATLMSRKEYADMEKDIRKFVIKKRQYVVYTWNDCSGYDYWNKDDESNYIQVSVSIRTKHLNKIDINALKADIDAVYDHFSIYDNVEAYFNNKASRS